MLQNFWAIFFFFIIIISIIFKETMIIFEIYLKPFDLVTKNFLNFLFFSNLSILLK